MTVIQVLERIAAGLPMKPGKVERCEFEYRRHGTQTLIAGFDVTIGKVFGVIGDPSNSRRCDGRFYSKDHGCRTAQSKLLAEKNGSKRIPSLFIVISNRCGAADAVSIGHDRKCKRGPGN
jgi:hypothetical protein